MKQIATKAIVLRRIDYGESDRILTLLTQDQGKVSVLAKGVRKPKSKLAGGVELFSIVDVVYFDGKSELKTLVSAQLQEHFGHIAEDISRSMMAYDCLKYTHIYTETVCEDAYFHLLEHCLRALHIGLPPVVIWVWFGVRLLQESGHGINTETDERGRKLLPQDNFRFDYQHMAFQVVQAASEATFTSAHIKLLRICTQHSLETVAQVQGTTEAAEQFRKCITETIKHYAQTLT